MKLVVPHKSLRLILLWTQRTLFAGAAAMLAYCGFVLIDASMFQKAEQREFARLLDARHDSAGTGPRTIPVGAPKVLPAVPIDGLIGRIELSRIGLSAIVMEGVTAKTLRRAVGHIPGTPLPGQPGNTCLSGHRDTFFRPLRNVQQNDIITLVTLPGKYRYRVVSIRIVSPRDVWVLDPSKNEVLTLVTCYPFYFVGSAPNRFIVRAERVT